MKANELRIGNYVWDDIFYYKVGSIEEDSVWGIIDKVHNIAKATTEDFYKEGDYHLDIENINGVPLTEEWLLKLGFLKKEFTDGSQYLEIDKTNYNKFGNPIHANTKLWKCYRVQYFKDKWYFGIYKDPRSTQSDHQKEIKFVHQLQNLYFALTGNKLEIK